MQIRFAYERISRNTRPSSSQVCLALVFWQATNLPEDYLHSHLKKRKIEDLVSEHTSGWTDTLLEVDVRAGARFVPMRLIVNMFRPETIEILYQDRLATTTEPHARRGLIQQSSAPIGLLGLSTTKLRDKCREHIVEMIKSLHYAPQVTAGEESRISYTILEAAQRYYMSTKSPLIGQALMLHAIHYYMKSFVTLTEESANNVYPVMQFYGVTREMYMSSRLLNRQIKYAMHKLSREITGDVLEGLERAMRSRTKDSWGTSFCTFLVLCLCMEGLQIASDTYVVCDMQRAGANSIYNRQQSVDACRNIDENPFSQCKRLFHDIYKSHRESHRVGREGGFNPLATLANNSASGLEQEADIILVNSIYEMVTRSYDEIITLSEKPLVVDENGFGIDPEMIKTNGAGRLVGSFLRSFFSPDWRPAD
ncbi:hypothetical protein BJ875DRAFT_264020 [Amylocarpus encephaloides]|uniref:Uncharacterized protein n=1 Tax=Amylocarpus encephaloides TaxID=45428 RepID=A0A9P8C6U5_9HELO|nr:hypothetical protein BJ875DRAFT_264020 [Amylocarpus encephaloides]